MTSKQRPPRRRSVHWMKILILLVAVLFLTRIVGQVQQYHALLGEAEQYRAQLATAQAEYAEKQETIDLLGNDAYIEREAREKLGMVKPGETVVSPVQVDDAVSSDHSGGQTDAGSTAITD